MKNTLVYTTLSCFTFFILFFLLAFVPATIASTPNATALRLQQRYDAMQSLTFDFFQHTEGAMAGRPQTGQGHAKFLKTDQKALMRWDYTEPETQVLTSDGITFSMYFQGLNQLIVTPAKNLESDITYSFFTGKGKLNEDFDILEADPENAAIFSEAEGLEVIKLIPKKSQSQVQDIHIWVTENSLIARIQIRDHFDTITVLSLSNIEADTLSKNKDTLASFKFTPPKDAEVIEQ